ncbi:UDP-N-acetylglucosamine 2-epimerase [Gracilimonas amylolytica]|uniref:UDP-N-acetylglucosamine 2-epimerase n=1 Tax=Gracilimonas amylolytica TaxID=1749045 RepID=UPI000CD82194|nr:UDP-N-acetylglucosamine 2-epimerase [Gracilimonas amylolytica]
MKIGVLTSSRADFGIYLPLLKKLVDDSFFDLKIIAFGTHGSPYHGETISEVKNTGFNNIDLIQSFLLNDNPNGISTSYGLTVTKFADYWKENSFDLVFCLGDRFEMSAAVQAGIPFGVKFAHLHGGETTLGAIDNIYRHQITLASTIHFSSTEAYKKKIKTILGDNEHVYNVGSLSLDGIEDFQFMEENEFRNNFGIPNKQYVLITFHPETIRPEKNQDYAIEMKSALDELSKEYFLIITMPNADTNGKIFRNYIEELRNEMPNQILCIENFGKSNYFNAMKYTKFLLGNTSSGIVEAASFGKYVVNVGNRQQGRARGENVIDCEFKANNILHAVSKVKDLGSFEGTNIYRKPNTVKTIIDTLKNNYASL